MTVIQAISQVDTLKFNQYSHGEKVRWLNTVENSVKRTVIDCHEGGDAINFTGYDTKGGDDHTQLLVPAPYDVLYLRWLEGMIDYHNGENGGYNAAMALFNRAFDDYRAWYGRTHMPKRASTRFLF